MRVSPLVMAARARRQYNKDPKPLKWEYDDPSRPPVLMIQWTSTSPEPDWLGGGS
jgi:hypothetical protein